MDNSHINSVNIGIILSESNDNQAVSQGNPVCGKGQSRNPLIL